MSGPAFSTVGILDAKNEKLVVGICPFYGDPHWKHLRNWKDYDAVELEALKKSGLSTFLIDQRFEHYDVVSDKDTSRLGYIFRRNLRADCRVIGYKSLLFDVDCLNLRSATFWSMDLDEHVVQYEDRVGLVTHVDFQYILRFADGALVLVDQSALERFKPLSESAYQNHHQEYHFYGERLRGDARDLIRMRPFPKLRNFEVSVGYPVGDFLPVFINETISHNICWLSHLRSPCDVDVIIDSIIPVRARIFFPKSHSPNSESLTKVIEGAELSKLRSIRNRVCENFTLRSTLRYILQPDDVLYTSNKYTDYESIFYQKMKGDPRNKLIKIPLQPSEPNDHLQHPYYKRNPLSVQRQMLWKSQSRLFVRRRCYQKRPSGIRWWRRFVRYQRKTLGDDAFILSSARATALVGEKPSFYRPLKTSKVFTNFEEAHRLRVGQMVPVELLLIRHTYDVVWQDTGTLETGVQALRLKPYSLNLDDHLIMPGDKVFLKSGLLIVASSWWEAVQMESRNLNVGIVLNVDQETKVCNVQFFEATPASNSRRITERTEVGVYDLAMTHFKPLTTSSVLRLVPDKSNAGEIGVYLNGFDNHRGTYEVVDGTGMKHTVSQFITFKRIFTDPSAVGDYEWKSSFLNHMNCLAKDLLRTCEHEHFREHHAWISEDKLEGELESLLIDDNFDLHLGIGRRLRSLLDLLSTMIRSLSFALDVDTSASDMLLAWLSAEIFIHKLGFSPSKLPSILPENLNMRDIVCTDKVLQNSLKAAIEFGVFNGRDKSEHFHPRSLVQKIADRVFILESAFFVMDGCCFEDYRLKELYRLCNRMRRWLRRCHLTFSDEKLKTCSCSTPEEHSAFLSEALYIQAQKMRSILMADSNKERHFFDFFRDGGLILKRRSFCNYQVVEKCRHFFNFISEKFLSWLNEMISYEAEAFCPFELEQTVYSAYIGLKGRTHGENWMVKSVIEKLKAGEPNSAQSVSSSIKPIPEEQRGVFQLEESAPDMHHFADESNAPPRQVLMRAWEKECKLLSTSLPKGITVKAYEGRCDLFSAMIIGPKGTPYEDGLFFFDFHLPAAYPNVPPQVHYYSLTLERVNPNLYVEGWVCLSLLESGKGQDTGSWKPGFSNLLQVLVSLQGLILNSEPYFNGADYKKQKNDPKACEASRAYNEGVVASLVQSMLRLMEHPPPVFQAEVKQHLQENLENYLKRIRFFATLDGESIAEGTFDEEQQLPQFPLAPVSKGFVISVQRHANLVLSTFESLEAKNWANWL